MSTNLPGDDSPLKFPTEFPIKAMGRAIIGVEDAILAIVRKHSAEQDILSVKTKPSSNGKYISVTVNIMARSRRQLDLIYMDLTASSEVILAL